MNRFAVTLSNADDLFLWANLSGEEPDLLRKLQARLRERHGHAVRGLRIARAFRVS